MNNKIKIIILFMLFLGACEKGYMTDCDKCTSDIPDDVNLIIKTSGGQCTIKIYEGPLEDNKLVFSVITSEVSYSYCAMFYKDYTIAAEYNINGKVYIAVDEARPKIRHDENTCDNPCYYIYDNTVDLTLKYTGQTFKPLP